MQGVQTQVMIGAQILAKCAVGDTIEDRFKAIITPSHLSDGCFMCSSEDEEFRSAVGGLMLSYPTDSPEQKRISAEMQNINRFSAMLQAAQLGMGVTIPETDDTFEPIGLLALWRARERR